MIDRIVVAVEVVVGAVGIACGVAGEEPAEDGVVVQFPAMSERLAPTCWNQASLMQAGVPVRKLYMLSKNLRHHCRLSNPNRSCPKGQAVCRITRCRFSGGRFRSMGPVFRTAPATAFRYPMLCADSDAYAPFHIIIVHDSVGEHTMFPFVSDNANHTSLIEKTIALSWRSTRTESKGGFS